MTGARSAVACAQVMTGCDHPSAYAGLDPLDMEVYKCPDPSPVFQENVDVLLRPGGEYVLMRHTKRTPRLLY